MNLVKLFCEVDDFCQSFERTWKKHLLTSSVKKRNRLLTLTLSEVMTIVIAFQDSAYRTFKDFYMRCCYT